LIALEKSVIVDGIQDALLFVKTQLRFDFKLNVVTAVSDASRIQFHSLGNNLLAALGIVRRVLTPSNHISAVLIQALLLS